MCQGMLCSAKYPTAVTVISTRRDHSSVSKTLMEIKNRACGQLGPRPTSTLPRPSPIYHHSLRQPFFNTRINPGLSEQYLFSFDDRETSEKLRKVLRKVPFPVVVVSTASPHDPSLRRGITVSSFTSISLQPIPLIAFCVKLPSRASTVLHESDRFVVQFLAADQIPHSVAFSSSVTPPPSYAASMVSSKQPQPQESRSGRSTRAPGDKDTEELVSEASKQTLVDNVGMASAGETETADSDTIRLQATTDPDPFEVLGYETDAESSLPVLLNTLGAVRCRTHQVMVVGDHEMWIGHVEKVLHGQIPSPGQEPLLYHDRSYRKSIAQRSVNQRETTRTSTNQHETAQTSTGNHAAPRKTRIACQQGRQSPPPGIDAMAAAEDNPSTHPSNPSIPGLSEFSAFTFPPPPARPGHVVLNRFVLYETKTRFYIVGTNAPAGTRFRVLKIDRTSAQDELSITEDETVYSKAQVDDLLGMIVNGNKATGGMREITKFYGIVGFVRFTEGYYMTLITKRSPVALIGGHYIFHIDATTTISIHSSTTPTSKLDKNSEEARYLQMFQMVDLTKNFYFSYSYDITRTLQWNMTRNPTVEGRNKMFVWNQYLLENAFGEQTGIENQWALPVMYGFVDQSKLSILGRNVYVTLIARRSRYFAGARFLKRGANDRGFVANDVETEQIVSEMSTTSFYSAGSTHANPNHTSFVQHRGSIPLYWTQDGTNMSPKPSIELNVIDPYFSAAALHFDDMFKRYGAPCIVLNLIKAKEKTPRESLLLKEFSECIEYLNQFLPEDKKIWHIKWDMSRAAKSPDENVISVLEIIAERTFAKTGFFHSGYNQEELEGRQRRSRKTDDANAVYGSGLQNGVVRTNCIDCLDRTNAAQFIIAKCALGHQLYSLGLIAEPVVPFDCDVVNMLTEMYHDHGDTIALQYGGSHLVNTMETYRKINQWTSHSRDMIESIRRFYSNSFVDAEKQDAMNLFLGNYRVQKGAGPALWELPGDYHLHNITDPELKKIRQSYTKWWTPEGLLPQDVLARKSFQEAHDRELKQFQLHDAGHDDFDGLPHYDDDEYEDSHLDGSPDSHQCSGEGNGGSKDTESRENAQESMKGFDFDPVHSADRLGMYDSNLKPSNGRERMDDQHQASHHIENIQSEDDEESHGTRRFADKGRVDSMNSMTSAHSLDSTPNQDALESSVVSSQHSSMDSITGVPVEGRKHPIRSSPSNPNITSSIPLDRETTDNASTDEEMVDFKDRIVAPLNMQREQPSVGKPGAGLMSSSSSVSSIHRLHLHRRHRLAHSRSRSSMASSRPRSSAYFSRGEQFVHDGFNACGDDDHYGESSGPFSGAWDEYWEEYYRPKVQTSFQRLFAYNMNSTSQYIPQNVKNTSEQSPFEVRQNHGILSQSEINARAAAKSDKPSMLSWLGLSGSNSSNNSKSRPMASKANSSKTLPLSTGRKKGIPSSLDDDPIVEKKLGHGSRLSTASYPTSGISEYDEKGAASGSLRQQYDSRDGKVRLPAHVPRTKQEEWELTKNVWTNLPKLAINDPDYVPAADMSQANRETKQKSSNANAESGLDGNVDGSKDGVAPAAAPNATSASPMAEGGQPKGRSHIEELVKRSLQPDVTPHEWNEYKRYTQQFKSIRFDSAPTKSAALFGLNAKTSQKDKSTSQTAPTGSVPGGSHRMDSQPQSPQDRDRMLHGQLPPMMAATRPGLIGAQDRQNSTTTIGSIELNEEEEFFYAAAASRPRFGARSKPGRNEGAHMAEDTNGHNAASSFSSFSPGTDGALQVPTEPNQLRDEEFLPEPPILLPLPTTIKLPSESELVLYNAHVELPKLTLYTVGQTSLNPYWGTSSGTRARYDAYMMWILKGRYGNMAANTATGGGGNGGAGPQHHQQHRSHPQQQQQQHHHHPQPPAPLRRGSSAIYQSFEAEGGLNSPGGTNGSMNGNREKQRQEEQLREYAHQGK
ncbi:phosphatidylinositol-3,5-bisphosphate 5-phosphatase [Mortierella alpina]|nr:phosphatidylinositol-3,5-bisphosphate 5-phosphatase [Mortierella alpina]